MGQHRGPCYVSCPEEHNRPSVVLHCLWHLTPRPLGRAACEAATEGCVTLWSEPAGSVFRKEEQREKSVSAFVSLSVLQTLSPSFFCWFLSPLSENTHTHTHNSPPGSPSIHRPHSRPISSFQYSHLFSHQTSLSITRFQPVTQADSLLWLHRYTPPSLEATGRNMNRNTHSSSHPHCKRDNSQVPEKTTHRGDDALTKPVSNTKKHFSKCIIFHVTERIIRFNLYHPPLKGGE